jgi:hypothetical protein
VVVRINSNDNSAFAGSVFNSEATARAAVTRTRRPSIEIFPLMHQFLHPHSDAIQDAFSAIDISFKLSACLCYAACWTHISCVTSSCRYLRSRMSLHFDPLACKTGKFLLMFRSFTFAPNLPSLSHDHLGYLEKQLATLLRSQL